jgi:CheY-like chemotaxis protein/anti-sigma regulatory factor (Ser/Thr protein kinase)
MPTILVVDDEAVDREQATRCLAQMDDLEVLHASDGKEALEIISARKPDLVLTDLRMPGMDGLELVGEVQRHYPLLPILLMTSQGNERVAVNALKAGASSYVPKSDLGDSLVETVEQVLDVVEAKRSRTGILRYLRHSETRFELLNDPKLISPVVGFLQASMELLDFGDDSVRTQVGMSVMEALSNAIIHGNLEVSSEIRKDSLREYYAEMQRRRDLPPYASRVVQCQATESTHRVVYVVEDQGPGFDTSLLPDPTLPEHMVRVHGRGILLMRTFMDSVEYNERGNRVVLTKELAPAPD